MTRRLKLRLPDSPGHGPRFPLGRIVAGGGLLIALCVLVLELGGLVLDDEIEAPRESETAPAAPDQAKLRLRALENVRARVEIDGKIVFDGVLAGGTDRSWPAGEVTAVELDDLTRATVYYGGQRVEPVGSLTAARRLEFVDDL
jgi:hypothetical protein